MDASAKIKITREKILEVYSAGPQAVIALIEGLVGEQEQRITALEQELQELRKDSHDSGKPPSRDNFERKQLSRKQSRRERHKRRPGGQPNHRGATLCQVDNPTAIRVHHVERCRCGRSLASEPVVAYERRQVFDLPPIEVQVTEHRGERKRCRGCSQISVATFPAEVAQPVQYGSRLQAVAVYLKNYGLLPYQRTAELFEDLFSIPLSVGTLVSLNDTCGHRLAGVSKAIRDAIADQPVVGFDETGMSIGGQLQWLHVASTELLTYYAAHLKRGQQAFADIAILPHFAGVAVHDHWQSYFAYGCAHALCNAHHLRELTFIEEQYHQPWATELKDLLLTVKDAVQSALHQGSQRLYRPLRKRFLADYRSIIKAGLSANPPPPAAPPGSPKKRGRKKQSKPRNLLLRLASRQRQVLAFMYDVRVPFTNNQAERDLRMMKVQQKISGTFRSADGATAFCRTRTYISTVRKHRLNVIDALRSVFDGHPITPPCLKPATPAE